MRESSYPDDLVRDRLRTVLTGGTQLPGPATAPQTSWGPTATLPAASSPAFARQLGRVAPGPSLMVGAEIVPVLPRPGWAGQPSSSGPSAAGPAEHELSGSALSGSALSGSALSGSALPGSASGSGDDRWPTGGGGTSGPGVLTGAGAFDPGRRGVRALAAAAAVVILIAAILAWRSRPHIEPVADVAEPIAAVDASGPAGASAAPAGEVVVAVAGKVRRPGLVRLPIGARVADALQAAGGVKAGTDPSLLNLARKVVDGELLLVGVTPPPGGRVAAGPAAGAAAPAAGAATGAPVNLNTATLADLDTLPGVGPVLAQRILDHREQHGGFKTVADLRTVDGIGNSRFEQLKDLVTV